MKSKKNDILKDKEKKIEVEYYDGDDFTLEELNALFNYFKDNFYEARVQHEYDLRNLCYKVVIDGIPISDGKIEGKRHEYVGWIMIREDDEEKIEWLKENSKQGYKIKQQENGTSNNN